MSESGDLLEKRVLYILIISAAILLILLYIIYDYNYGDMYKNRMLLHKRHMHTHAALDNLSSSYTNGIASLENKMNGNVTQKQDQEQKNWSVIDESAILQPVAPGFEQEYDYDGMDYDVAPSNFSKFVDHSRKGNGYMLY